MNGNFSDTGEKLAYYISTFYDNYPLYYHFLSSLAKYRTKEIPTMGVGFDLKQVPTLFYNPEFVEKLSDIDMRVLLNHECQHLGLRHLQRYGAREKMLANIAMDVAVNFNIPELKDTSEWFHKGAMTADRFKSLDGVDIRETTWEQIYELIKQQRDKMQKQFEKMMSEMGDGMDSHEKWGNGQPKDGKGQGQDGKDKKEGSGLTPAQEAALDGLYKDSVRKLNGRDPGNIPGNIRREVEKMLEVKFDWRRQLSIFAQTIAKDETTPTWKRPSRRFGVISPGKRKDFRPRLLTVVDNSGSISKPLYDMFSAHMIKIAEICEEVAVIGCDTRVNFEGKIEKGKAPAYKDLSSGGGTSFQPAFDYAKEHGYDGVIYFTDGCFFDQWVAHGVPVIFALCPGANEVIGYRNVHIEPEGEKDND